MNYFLDLEFHEHQRPVKVMGITIAKVWTIDLISIGIVRADGHTYYACNRDLNLKHVMRDPWLVGNVVVNLPAKFVPYPPEGSPRLWEESQRWRTMDQIRQEVLKFMGWHLHKNSELRVESNVKVYGYYSDYDWVRFCWIFGRMIDLPKGMPMYCIDLKQMLDDMLDRINIPYDVINTSRLKEAPRGYATFEEKLKWIKTFPEYPKEENEHNALADAKWNFELWKFVMDMPHIIATKWEKG